MGADYSFGMDNNQLLKGFLRLRNGGIIFTLSAIIAIISGIMYPIYYLLNDDSIGYALWFFELINFFLISTATIFIYSSFSIIKNNVNEKNEHIFNLTRILLLIFFILFSLFTIIVLTLHWIDDIPFISMAKNMVAYLFLTAFLLAFSFSFKDLERIGYGTRLLYVPLIFLTIPSIASLILGCFNLTTLYHRFDIVNFFSSIVNLYMVIFLFFTFLEIYLVLRRMTNLIDVHYVLKTPESEPIMKSAVPAKK